MNKFNSKYIKVADNEFILNRSDLNVRYDDFTSFTCFNNYTPTHIYTYPDGDPNDLREIQKIDYTKSNVTFYKDNKNNKCCIDIYDDQTNPNKCRIIGLNGHIAV
eukprot:jgi/Orpsp1_1/1184758/evm.model.c7180000090880.1